MTTVVAEIYVGNKSPMFFGTEDEEKQRNLDLAVALNNLEKEGLVVVGVVIRALSRNTCWLVLCAETGGETPAGEIEVHEFKLGFDRPVTHGSPKEEAVLLRKLEEHLNKREAEGLLRIAAVPLDDSHQRTWIAVYRRVIKD